jgi:cyclic 2,3-diphosphoglycerate synthase
VVVGAHQDPDVSAGYLNAYRLLVADLVVLTMAEPDLEWERTRERIAATIRPGVPVVATVLHPRPLASVRDRTVAYFSAAPTSALERLREHLEAVFGARVVHVSGNLANRAALRDELEQVSAEVYLVELKAAAVDVVAEAALANGADVALAANDVVAVPGDPDLDEQLLRMAKFKT